MRTRFGLPLASNVCTLLLARWWLAPAAPAVPRAPRAAAPPLSAEADPPRAADEAAGLQVPLADCLAAALDAREGARACPSPCAPCPACEADGEARPSLSWEVGFGGLLLLASELARWAFGLAARLAACPLRLAGGASTREVEEPPVVLDSPLARPRRVGGRGRFS